MLTLPMLATALLLSVVSIAAVWDIRTRRIPNKLILIGLIAALATQLWAHGYLAGLWFWCSGCLTGMSLFLVFYLLRGMGAGDVKLMGVVGAFTGPVMALEIGLVACVIGGLMAIAMLVWKRQGRRALASLSVIVMSPPTGDLTSGHGTATSGVKLPYAVAIAVGTLLVTAGGI